MPITIERIARYIAHPDHELQGYERIHLTTIGYRLHRGVWITPQRFTLVQEYGKTLLVPEPGK